MTAKHVVFIVNCLDIGGAEIQVVRLAQGLIRRGSRVAVISLLPTGPLVEPLEAAGAQVFSLDMRRGTPDPTAILKLRRILRRLRPDVVHSHILHSNILTRVTRLIAPIPVLICTAHNLVESGPFLERMYRYTDRLCDLTTNVSQAAVDRYIDIRLTPRDRIRFVPNGLDMTSFPCDADKRNRLRTEMGVGDRFVWLAVGRFRVQKDYPNMLRAFAVASAKDPTQSLLLIAGSGPTEDEAHELASTLKLMDRVRFLGIRNDVPALMNMADGFVLSSAWEGMPLVLQEAAASGLTIVATDVGGNREVVLDGKSAFLVPPRDSLALADAMQRLVELPLPERQAMARAGREYVVSHFDIERVLDRWEAIYSELMDRAPDGQPAHSAAESVSG